MKNEILTNENKGFSLVELIVVIAIMAVMTSVLAPSLLGYVEQSRMAKDDSAMGEVTNAIKLALADQDVYDECLIYNVKENVSCYVDSNLDPENATIIIDKCHEGLVTHDEPCDPADGKEDYWHYGDDTRLADEEVYTTAGNMRGMTLTFVPSFDTNASSFVMSAARVNEVIEGTIKKGSGEGTRTETLTINNMTTGSAGKTGMLYNKLRAVIGDSITLSSQTYRNSEYTVFIRMGSMGGRDSGAQDAVAVYGQWNGTNLTEEDYGD